MRRGRRAAGWRGVPTVVLVGLLLALILVPAWRTTPILALEAPVLRIVVPDIAGYDAVYKRLIKAADFAEVSSSFALEEIKNTTALPLGYLR